MSNVRTCHHVKDNGEYCEAVAMNDNDFCYYHDRDRQRRTNILRCLQLRRIALDPGSVGLNLPPNQEQANEASATLFESLELPLLDSRLAIQVTITNLLRAVATRQIDTKHAALMLYGLQIAVMNVGKTANMVPDGYTKVALSDPEPLPTPVEVDCYDPREDPPRREAADEMKKLPGSPAAKKKTA